MAEEPDEFRFDDPAEVAEHRENHPFMVPNVVFRHVKTEYPAANSTLASYNLQPETANNLATYNPLSPEIEALTQALHYVLDQHAAGQQAPLEVNQHTVSQEDPAKIRIHAPNSDAFIELMTPEEPDRVTTLCETAVDLLNRSNCQVTINGEPGTVVPHPYLSRAPHIEGAVPQYAWLAYLGAASPERSLLPSIIFTRTDKLLDNLETTHGRGQGLGFWEHTSPLSGEPSIYLVSLGKASLEYQSNSAGDVEDVVQIIAGIEADVEQAETLQKAAQPQGDTLNIVTDMKEPARMVTAPSKLIGNLKLRHALAATIALYTGYSVASGVAMAIDAYGLAGILAHGGHFLSDGGNAIEYQFAHPFNHNSPLREQARSDTNQHSRFDSLPLQEPEYCDPHNICVNLNAITATSIQPVGALSLKAGAEVSTVPVATFYIVRDFAHQTIAQLELPTVAPLPTDKATLTAHNTAQLASGSCEEIPGTYDGSTELFTQTPLDKGLHFTVVSPTTLKVCRVTAAAPKSNEMFYLHRK